MTEITIKISRRTVVLIVLGLVLLFVVAVVFSVVGHGTGSTGTGSQLPGH